MRKIIALIQLQGKSIIQQRAVLAVFLALPLTFGLFLLYGLQPLFTLGQEDAYVEPFDVALVDLDQSMETRAIIHQLTSSEEFQRVVHFRHVTEGEGLDLVKQDLAAAMVVVPENFSADLRIGKNTPFEVVGNPQRPLQHQLFLAMMKSGADLISAAQSGVNTVHFFLKDEVDADVLQAEVDQAIVDFTFQALGRNQVFESVEVTETGSFTLEEYYVAAGLVILALLVGVILLTFIRSEFTTGMEKRLALVGYSPFVKLTTKFLVGFLVIGGQLGAVLAVYFLMLDGVMTGNGYMLVVITLGISAVVSMFYTFLSAWHLPPFSELIVGLVSLVFLVVLGGSILPLSFFPPWMKEMAVYTFSYWMREGFLYSAFIDDQKVFHESVTVLGISFMILFVGAYLLEKRKGRV